jgi:hypothetical protein
MSASSFFLSSSSFSLLSIDVISRSMSSSVRRPACGSSVGPSTHTPTADTSGAQARSMAAQHATMSRSAHRLEGSGRGEARAAAAQRPRKQPPPVPRAQAHTARRPRPRPLPHTPRTAPHHETNARQRASEAGHSRATGGCEALPAAAAAEEACTTGNARSAPATAGTATTPAEEDATTGCCGGARAGSAG